MDILKATTQLFEGPPPAPSRATTDAIHAQRHRIYQALGVINLVIEALEDGKEAERAFALQLAAETIKQANEALDQIAFDADRATAHGLVEQHANIQENSHE
jgi:hypothetical protein